MSKAPGMWPPLRQAGRQAGSRQHQRQSSLSEDLSLRGLPKFPQSIALGETACLTGSLCSLCRDQRLGCLLHVGRRAVQRPEGRGLCTLQRQTARCALSSAVRAAQCVCPLAGDRRWETLFSERQTQAKDIQFQPLAHAPGLSSLCLTVLLPGPCLLVHHPPHRPGKAGRAGLSQASWGEEQGTAGKGGGKREEAGRDAGGCRGYRMLADTPHPLSQDGVQRRGWFLKIKRDLAWFQSLLRELPLPTLGYTELRPRSRPLATLGNDLVCSGVTSGSGEDLLLQVLPPTVRFLLKGGARHN